MNIIIQKDSSVKTSCKDIANNKATEIYWYASVSVDQLSALKQALADLISGHDKNKIILKTLAIYCMFLIYMLLFICLFIFTYLLFSQIKDLTMLT